MESYQSKISNYEKILNREKTWNAIEPERAARMNIQNRFKSGVDIGNFSYNYIIIVT